MSSTQLLSPLVGGTLVRNLDFAPSIVFAVAFSILIPVFFIRLFDKRSRTTLMWGVGAQGFEKLGLFSIRAANASTSKYSPGLMMYMQPTIAMGPMFILADLGQILRSTLVNSTYTPVTHPFPNEVPPSVIQAAEDNPTGEDQPRRRFWLRRFHDTTWLLHIPALVTGVFGNLVVQFQKNGATALSGHLHRMRIASSTLILLLIVWESSVSILARQRLTRVNKRVIDRLIIYYFLLAIPQIYRLTILNRTTPSMFLLDTASNNTPLQKAMFYTFHFVPEWMVCVLHLSVRAREFFECGWMGDVFWWDETPEQRQTRLEKVQKAQEKRERRRVEKAQPV